MIVHEETDCCAHTALVPPGEEPIAADADPATLKAWETAGEPTPVAFELTRGGPASNDVHLDVRLGWPQEGDGPFADEHDFTGGEVWGRNSGGVWQDITPDGGFSFGQRIVTLPAGYGDMHWRGL